MRKIILLVFVIFSILASCSRQNKSDQKVDKLSHETGDSIEKEAPEVERYLPAIHEFVWDDFAIDPFFEDSEKIANLRNLNYSAIDTLPVENNHIPDQVDTIYSFIFNESTIRIYKLPDKEFVISSELYEDLIPIKHGLKIGDSKQAVCNKFQMPDKINIESDSLRITVGESDQWVDLLFKNDSLKKISFVGYFD